MPRLAFFLGVFLWLPVPPSLSAFLYRWASLFAPAPFPVSSQLSTTVSTWILCFWPYSHAMSYASLLYFLASQSDSQPLCISAGKLMAVCAGPCHQDRLCPEHSVNTMFLEQRFHIYQNERVWQEYEGLYWFFFLFCMCLPKLCTAVWTCSSEIS